MKTPIHSTLGDKNQELIAVGASIASGCQPCTTFHFRAAHLTGADEAEIRQAVDVALAVRHRATENMARFAAQRLGQTAEPAPVGSEPQSLLSELIAVSAAFAANCVAELETHLAAAKQQGATGDQILTTFKIAGAVKDMAGKKAMDAATRAMGASEARNADCGCQEDAALSGEPVHAAAAGAAAQTETCTPDCTCQK